MSDDTKNQLLRSDLRAFGAPTPIGNTRYFWQDACDEAADAIERLERDRDALAERCEKLREALRRNAVKDGYCAECSERPDWRTWVGTNPERHAEGCLAAPKDAP